MSEKKLKFRADINENILFGGAQIKTVGEGSECFICRKKEQKEQKVYKDYSATCNLDDEDFNNDCWNCSRYGFMGCNVRKKRR